MYEKGFLADIFLLLIVLIKVILICISLKVPIKAVCLCLSDDSLLIIFTVLWLSTYVWKSNNDGCVYGWWVLHSLKNLSDFVYSACRSSTLSYVMPAHSSGLVAEYQAMEFCLLIWWKQEIGTVILKMSMCVFLVIHLFFNDSSWEDPILSPQWYNLCFEISLILSDLIHCRKWNHHQFSFTLSGFNTIQGKYEYFSFLSLISYFQLSVSNWEREREMIWPSPLLFLHLSFCLLILDNQLSLSLTVTGSWR